MNKRFWFGLLAMTLSLVMVTCGTQAALSAAAADANDIMGPFAKYKEPVTFTYGRRIATKGLAPGETYDDNMTTRYIQEKVNVLVQNAWAVDDNTYDQKVALSIASGDLPDVMLVSDRKTLRQMYEAGLLEDLTDVFTQTLSPFLKEQYASFGENHLSDAMFDGRLMAIPGCNIGGAHNLLWIRQDWLDKVGMQPPKTVDDIIEIAKAFIEKDPGGNGAGKTIGLTGRQEVAGIYNSMHGLDTVFGVYGAFPGKWVKDASGQVIYGSVMPEMKEALIKLNQMYTEGVLDPQFAMRKDSDSDALVIGGKCGMMFGAWWAPYYPLAGGVQNDPQANWKPYMVPLDYQGNLHVCTQDTVNKFLVVKKGYAHPEAVIKVLNCENEIFRGTNPEALAINQKISSANIDWGTPIGLQIDYNNQVARFYGDLKAAVDSKDPSTLRSDYKVAYDNVIKNMENPGVDSAAWGEATARIDGQALCFAPGTVFHENVFFGTTSTMELKWANLKKFEDENIIKFIMGAAPIDDFDKYVEQWMKLGGQEITAEVTQAVNAAGK